MAAAEVSAGVDTVLGEDRLAAADAVLAAALSEAADAVSAGGRLEVDAPIAEGDRSDGRAAVFPAAGRLTVRAREVRSGAAVHSAAMAESHQHPRFRTTGFLPVPITTAATTRPMVGAAPATTGGTHRGITAGGPLLRPSITTRHT